MISEEVCCGCYACKSVCPKNAIEMYKNKNGFICSKIDNSKCINCNKCTKVCPMSKEYKNDKFSDEILLAYANDDEIRKKCSSGGIFGIIATEIFIKNNGIVCGAAFDDNLQLKHVCAENEDDLKKIFKSKYIQSNTDGIYEKIENILRNTDKPILFVGTPCQVAALKKYLVKDYENLYVIDIVCHGVPSQDLFDKWKRYEENKNKCIITSFQFRYKDNKLKHLHAYKYTIRKNGKNKDVMGLHYENPYYFGFQKHITMRDSCYKCKYATIERSGDITLGDFWGIEKYNPKLDTSKRSFNDTN